MSGLPFGMVVEGSVSVLLAVTIGYCAVLNGRLKRLHADREALRQMAADLVQATGLANGAVSELRQTASETDVALTARLAEAERLRAELADQLAAGQQVLERIARITAVARQGRQPVPPPVVEPPALPEVPSKLQAALRQLAERERLRGEAA